MAATLTAYNAVLQRVWTQKRLEEQLFQETALLDKIERTDRFTIGEVARVPLHVSRNGGYTVLPDGGGNLNTAGNQGTQKSDFSYTNHHQQIAIQGDVIDRTSGNANAIASVVETEVTGATTDLRRQLQRQLYGNGDALIAQCRASASNNVDLNLVSGGNALKRGWIFVGQPVDVGTTANEVAIVDNSLVTAVDIANTAFTVAAGNQAGEGTTHYVSQANARSGATSYEMNGLRNLAATSGSFGTLATSSEPTWAAAGADTTSQPLSVSLMLQADQAIHQLTGAKADTIVMGLKQQRKFYEQLQQQVRFSSDGAISAGQSAENPKWGTANILVDPDCPDEDMYFLQMKHLFLVAMDKPYWQNKISGGEILAWIQGTDSYGAKLTWRGNLATNRRQGAFRYGGLS